MTNSFGSPNWNQDEWLKSRGTSQAELDKLFNSTPDQKAAQLKMSQQLGSDLKSMQDDFNTKYKNIWLDDAGDIDPTKAALQVKGTLNRNLMGLQGENQAKDYLDRIVSGDLDPNNLNQAVLDENKTKADNIFDIALNNQGLLLDKALHGHVGGDFAIDSARNVLPTLLDKNSGEFTDFYNTSIEAGAGGPMSGANNVGLGGTPGLGFSPLEGVNPGGLPPGTAPLQPGPGPGPDGQPGPAYVDPNLPGGAANPGGAGTAGATTTQGGSNWYDGYASGEDWLAANPQGTESKGGGFGGSFDDFMKFMMMMNMMGGFGGRGGYGGSQYGYGGLNPGGVQSAYNPLEQLQGSWDWFNKSFGSGGSGVQGGTTANVQ